MSGMPRRECSCATEVAELERMSLEAMVVDRLESIRGRTSLVGIAPGSPIIHDVRSGGFDQRKWKPVADTLVNTN